MLLQGGDREGPPGGGLTRSTPGAPLPGPRLPTDASDGIGRRPGRLGPVRPLPAAPTDVSRSIGRCGAGLQRWRDAFPEGEPPPYPIVLMMLKIGRYMAMIMPPTIVPRMTIMMGSMALSSVSTALSTSSS